MTHSLHALCSAIKKIIGQLKPEAQGFSFLILTGKTSQGKTTLMRQSHFQSVTIEGPSSSEIFYNEHGIIVSLGESWLEDKSLLASTLKQLNRCHAVIKISGIILCVNAKELMITEASEFSNIIASHSQLPHRFTSLLGYSLDTAIVVTKLDFLAGFCEFYQQDHPSDLNAALGFSLNDYQDQEQVDKMFKAQFDRFLESINQHILTKIHPARSSIKRTLIREFPLQLASLSLALQTLVESISTKSTPVRSIYFTSGEQSGFSLDSLNSTIQHEFSLTLQDKLPLSNNYRAYFIQGALLSFQAQTKRYRSDKARLPISSIAAVAAVATLALSVLIIHHVQSSHLLDTASKEWLTYDSLAHQPKSEAAALYHLSKATASLDQLHSAFIPRSVQKLHSQLKQAKSTHLNTIFLPAIAKEVEQVLLDAQLPQSTRYDALKTYLMLSDSSHRQDDYLTNWFRQQWQKNYDKRNLEIKLNLLQQALRAVATPSFTNQQLITDARNYFNALPVSYLYYSLAKARFPQETQGISVKGFVLAQNAVPQYFTKSGFRKIIGTFPQFAQQLQAEQWVLNREVPQQLGLILEQAYAYDYALWWKTFMQKTAPMRAQNYQEAIHLAEVLRQSNTITQLVELIQTHTSPDLSQSNSVFNQQVASEFTDLNLMNRSSLNQLSQTFNELERFLTTISIVADQGKTAFAVTKSRFQGDNLTNPLHVLFNSTQQLPEPVAAWSKQIASDTWSILLADTKQYINKQWQNTVYQDYLNSIVNRYPFDTQQTAEVDLDNFNRFFANHGTLNTFVDNFIKPFLDTSTAQWKPKELNDFVLPISQATLDEIMRANVITTMFFPNHQDSASIKFSLQKSDLNPDVASLHLAVGNTTIDDTQDNNSFTRMQWPQINATLNIISAEGKEYSLNEEGVWAFFKLLQKVNVQLDEQDPSKLQVLFEINGNSGRYILKTQNDLNPFTPGILNGFNLSESIA